LRKLGLAAGGAGKIEGWQINDAAAIRPSKLNYCRIQNKRQKKTARETKSRSSLATVDGYILWLFQLNVT